MATSHEHLAPPTELTPDSLYAYCLVQLDSIRKKSTPVRSFDIGGLLWSIRVSLAHAAEIASRILALSSRWDHKRVPEVVTYLLDKQDPMLLYLLFALWRKRHPRWPEADILRAPVQFMVNRDRFFRHTWEVTRRIRHLPLPVGKAFAGLHAGPIESNSPTARGRRLIAAMDRVLQDTVGRNLHTTTNPKSYCDDASSIADAESIALLGAVEEERRLRARIVELLNSSQTITTKSGRVLEVPGVPVLPIPGLERAEGMDAIWRAAAQEMADKVMAGIATLATGMLESALPDAAEEAQRAVTDRADAKMRGGSGGRQAERAGTASPSAIHVPLEKFDDECVIFPDRPITPLEQLERNEEALLKQHNLTLLRGLSEKLWGEPGTKMMDALFAGKTQVEAGEAAGISGAAVCKRLQKLRKHFDV